MKKESTDWNHYYLKPYKTAGLTKPRIIKKVLGYLTRYVMVGETLTITEFGGGNSCFFEPFQEALAPHTYYIVDNNAVGLGAFSKRFGKLGNARLYKADVLQFRGEWQSDLVFSVGLIEHFTEENTRRAIDAHLEVLKPGGILILGFPTPTWLYRSARFVFEKLGLWRFPDERPLTKKEVVDVIASRGLILEQDILWSIILTQAFIVLRKYPKL